MASIKNLRFCTFGFRVLYGFGLIPDSGFTTAPEVCVPQEFRTWGLQGLGS